jgi:hypothetical protein
MRRTTLLPFLARTGVMSLIMGGVARVRSGGTGRIDPSTSGAIALSFRID